MATQPCFQIDANGDTTGDHANANMGAAIARNARPSIVTLESGIQAIIEIAGFTYIDGIPIAVSGALAEDVNTSDILEGGADGIKLKLKA